MNQSVDLEAMSREMTDELRRQFPTVGRLEIEEGTDSTGDPALFIWVLLDDNVKDADLSWKAIQPLVDKVESIARARQSDAWPYARVRRLKEWEERFFSPQEEASPL